MQASLATLPAEVQVAIARGLPSSSLAALSLSGTSIAPASLTVLREEPTLQQEREEYYHQQRQQTLRNYDLQRHLAVIQRGELVLYDFNELTSLDPTLLFPVVEGEPIGEEERYTPLFRVASPLSEEAIVSYAEVKGVELADLGHTEDYDLSPAQQQQIAEIEVTFDNRAAGHHHEHLLYLTPPLSTFMDLEQSLLQVETDKGLRYAYFPSAFSLWWWIYLYLNGLLDEQGELRLGAGQQIVAMLFPDRPLPPANLTLRTFLLAFGPLEWQRWEEMQLVSDLAREALTADLQELRSYALQYSGNPDRYTAFNIELAEYGELSGESFLVQ